MFNSLLKLFKREGNESYPLSLKEIKKVVAKLSLKISASKDLLPTYGYSRDMAYPHVEVNSEGYHYVVVERGQERSRKTTKELDELLYWIFEKVTFSIASNYELNNRIENQDFRWILFQKQDELLGILNSSWKQKSIIKHSFLLKGYPQ